MKAKEKASITKAKEDTGNSRLKVNPFSLTGKILSVP